MKRKERILEVSQVSIDPITYKPWSGERTSHLQRVWVMALAFFRQKLKSITILNVVTKRHWRYKSRLNMIRQILKNLTNVAAIYDLKTVALPVIGAGLGGLPPEKVIDLCKLELPNPFGIEFTLHIWE